MICKKCKEACYAKYISNGQDVNALSDCCGAGIDYTDGKKFDGGPAFPVVFDGNIKSNSMTLRDYFAAQAMPNLITKFYDSGFNSEKDVARWAYEFADAMLEEREK